MTGPSPHPPAPPGGQVPGLVPVRSVIAGADNAKVALIDVKCFRSGCLFELHCVSRYLSSPTTEEAFFAEDSLVLQPQSAVAADSDPHVLRLAVSAAASTDGGSEAGFHADLRVTGGSATRDQEQLLRYLTQQYWAEATLPSTEVTLIVNWPAYEIDDQRFTIDGARLRDGRSSADDLRL